MYAYSPLLVLWAPHRTKRTTLQVICMIHNAQKIVQMIVHQWMVYTVLRLLECWDPGIQNPFFTHPTPLND